MDLVEIRKKAKRTRKKPAKKPAAKVETEILDSAPVVDDANGQPIFRTEDYNSEMEAWASAKIVLTAYCILTSGGQS